MTLDVRRAAVIGAGVMGGAIAAHLSNVGIAVLLLDVPGDGEGPVRRNAVAQRGLERALGSSPNLFYDRRSARLIEVGNIEDDLERVRDCDIIIEAIVERLDAKRALFARLAALRAPHAIVSSNTSGISVNAMAEGLPDDFRRNFLVTHFFNPVRYMKLLELVPSRDTDPAVVEAWRVFGATRLGKGVVLCKDTPNFIANRLGVYGFMIALNRTLEMGYGFDEVDTILGEPMGRPRSAIFRTCDISGLDVLMHVAQGVYDSALDDESRAAFNPPPLLREMVARGWLGEKSGQGFYKRIRGKDGSEILVLDPKTMEYRPRERVRFDSIGEVRENPDAGARMRGILGADDRAARFVRPLTYDLLAYSARRVPEIADSPAEVDAAMRWGFAWALGPFQTWDALGVSNVVKGLEEQGIAVPPLAREVLERGEGSFYAENGPERSVFMPAAHAYTAMPAEAITAMALRRRGAILAENRGAALLDMGDGVALLEYRTKMNTIDDQIVAMTREALERAGRDFRALVIGNDAPDFSVGANVAVLLMASRMRQWAQIERVIKAFQDVNMAVKYSAVPVVVAAAGRTLGGGCEILMQCARSRVGAETYCGLVETGVGLIPAGGGCKELLLRGRELVKEKGPFGPVRQALETIAFATVSTSAAEARRYGFLRSTDGITLDRALLLAEAKADAITLAEGGYTPPQPAALRLPGAGGRLVLEQQIQGMQQAGKISEHDAIVGCKLAYVLSGGDCSPIEDVSEQQVLDLEREAFLSLCGMAKTQERIQHTLATGKPLRN